MEITAKELEKRFGRTPVTDSLALHAMDEIRHIMSNAALEITLRCPDSRERSLALTALEEASMWAVKSIAVNSE
jgi:hypothetical protein